MNRVYAFLVVLPVVCDPGVVAQRPVQPTASSGELVVLTRNSATTRYIDAQGGYAGLEYDLVELFARDLGVNVRYLDRQPFYQVLRSLGESHAHLAAAGVAVTPARLEQFRFGPAYQLVQPVLAYNTSNPAPRNLGDLAGTRVEVVKGSGVVDRLRQLKRRYPTLNWTEVAENDSEGLLSRLSE